MFTRFVWPVSLPTEPSLQPFLENFNQSLICLQDLSHTSVDGLGNGIWSLDDGLECKLAGTPHASPDFTRVCVWSGLSWPLERPREMFKLR